jgi:hypothetical protein
MRFLHTFEEAWTFSWQFLINLHNYVPRSMEAMLLGSAPAGNVGGNGMMHEQSCKASREL